MSPRNKPPANKPAAGKRPAGKATTGKRRSGKRGIAAGSKATTATTTPVAAGERLQKLLAQHGLGSRREIDDWVTAGRVSVNGEVAVPGTRATASDRIRLDGEIIRLGTRPRGARVLRYHKPVGEVCTRSDPEGRPTVFDHLPLLRNGRWVAVGRLDLTTSGLMLFTDDGSLANRLMHPSSGVEREYAVRVHGEAPAEVLARLCKGVELDGVMARFESLREAGGEGSNRWFHVVLREGRNREVRRMWESQGVTVSRLIRVRYGPVGLPRLLPQGRWESLPRSELDALLECVGLRNPVPPRRTRPGAARGDRPPRGRRPG